MGLVNAGAVRLAAAARTAALVGPALGVNAGLSQAGSCDATSQAAQGAKHDLADRLCIAMAGIAGVQGVSLCVVFTPGMSVPAGVSDAAAARAEELQFSTGEGACWEAYRSGAVVVADLTGAAAGLRWPAYTAALRREVAYEGVVAVPVELQSGLSVVLIVYGPVTEPLPEAMPGWVNAPSDGPGERSGDQWWSSPEVVSQALSEVLDAANTDSSVSGRDWLDASTTLRRASVWVAESMLMAHRPWLDYDSAQEALRTFGAIEGATVDEVAAALVVGRWTVVDVLGEEGRLPQPRDANWGRLGATDVD